MKRYVMFARACCFVVDYFGARVFVAGFVGGTKMNPVCLFFKLGLLGQMGRERRI